MPDDGASFLDLLFGKADGDANLEGRWHDLLRLEVILMRLEAGDQDSVGKALLYCQLTIGLTGSKKGKSRTRTSSTTS